MPTDRNCRGFYMNIVDGHGIYKELCLGITARDGNCKMKGLCMDVTLPINRVSTRHVFQGDLYELQNFP